MIKPKQIEDIVLSWSCMVPEHRHKKYEVAERCIEKTKHPPQKAKLLRQQAKERRLKICAMYEKDSMTYAEIGAEMGISKERTRQIVIQTQHHREWEKKHQYDKTTE